MSADPDSGPIDAVETDSTASPADKAETTSEPRFARAIGVIAVVVTAGLAGWLGYSAWQVHRADQQRDLFLRAATQSAVDLTTIRHDEAEADVQRILDSSTGNFHDEFQKRRQAFVDRIRQDLSNSQGTVTGAGLQSIAGNTAQVLVAVTVKLSTIEVAEKKLDGFRLRMQVQKVGDGAKVSDVEYVQ